MIDDISAEDGRHLLAAQGWLELGDAREAKAELAQISPGVQAHPDVLELRWQIEAKSGNWRAGVQTGRALIKAAPQRASSWIHCAFALHEMKHTREAYDLLAPAATRFPSEWVIPYNLACYTAQL